MERRDKAQVGDAVVLSLNRSDQHSPHSVQTATLASHCSGQPASPDSLCSHSNLVTALFSSLATLLSLEHYTYTSGELVLAPSMTQLRPKACTPSRSRDPRSSASCLQEIHSYLCAPILPCMP
jgi:hypothetical protein